MWSSASAATASPSCMSLSEARHAHPEGHLWWHGEHCWDDRQRIQVSGPTVIYPRAAIAEPLTESTVHGGRRDRPNRELDSPDGDHWIVPLPEERPHLSVAAQAQIQVQSELSFAERWPWNIEVIRFKGWTRIR